MFSGEELVLTGTANTIRIGKTQNLRSGSWGHTGYQYTDDEEPVEFYVGRAKYDFGALSAIWEGFSNLSTTDNLKPSFTCSTGNCTWPPYASLAVCSVCNDISSHVTRFSSRERARNYVVNYTGYEIKGQNLNIIGANGLVSEWSPTNRPRKTELAAQSTCNPGKTVSFRHLKTLIISFSMLRVSPLYLNNSQNWENATTTAEECALYFCTNIYRSAIEQGVLRETVLGSYSNRNLDSYKIHGANLTRSKFVNHSFNHSLYLVIEDLMLSQDVRKALLRDEEQTLLFWDTDLQLLISKEEYLSATGVRQVDDLRLNITRETTYTLLNWFRDEFSRQKKLRNDKMIFPDPSIDESQPAVMSALGTSSNLTRTFENVAASLTKWIRNRSLETEPFVGESK